MNTVFLSCRSLFINLKRCYVTRPNKLAIAVFSRNKFKLLIGLVPVVPSVAAEDAIKSVHNEILSKTGDRSSGTDDSEKPITGENPAWDRLCALYRVDEFGNYSKEMTAVYQSVFFATFIGLIYGGVTSSREAFIDFMERNQDSIFKNHLDAKRRLQNHVTIHFGKGAFRWAIRLSAFTGGFMLFLTSLAAYRGYYSVLDYTISGTLIGALIRCRIGPPAIVIGGITGGILGLLCGLSTQTMLSLTGSSLDDVLAFQYELDRRRQNLFKAAEAKAVEQSYLPKETVELLKLREANDGGEKGF